MPEETYILQKLEFVRVNIGKQCKIKYAHSGPIRKPENNGNKSHGN